MNLVTNSSEAMTEGGSVVISTQNRYVDLPIRGYSEVAESHKGAGTRFTLYFPVTPRAAIEKDHIDTVAREEFRGEGELILIVDDVEEQRTIATMILAELGYQVTTASSGEMAIEYLSSHSVDLIILDMIMDPGMDGLDTYRQVINLHPGQKTIVASGYSETERVREAQELGVGQYLKKPYTIQQLGKAMKTELEK